MTQAEAIPEGAWIEMPDKQVHPLGADCYFGRTSGNEIVVPDTRTSRRHAVVQRQGGRHVLVDLGSTNGTRLNDRRIFKPTTLGNGDVIGIGGLRYVFHAPAGGAEGPVTNPPAPTSAAVGITPCWILVALVPEGGDGAAGAWMDGLARASVGSGAKARRLRPAALLVHWRESQASPAAVRGFAEDLARQPLPSGARLSLHHGQVRVSPGASATEEMILGPEATLAHGLAVAAEGLGARFVASAAAVRTLGLEGATPLGPRKLPGIPEMLEAYSLAQAAPR